MKKIALIFCLGLIYVTAFGQSNSPGNTDLKYFEKGENLVGMQFNGGWGKGGAVGSLNLRYGHFWFTQFNAGIQTNYSFNRSFHQSIGVGSFARYYMLNKKLAPFLEASYTYTGAKLGNGASVIEQEQWNQRAHTFFGGGGLAYTGIFKRFGIELFGGYDYSPTRVINHPTLGTYREALDRFSYGLRINFHF